MVLETALSGFFFSIINSINTKEHTMFYKFTDAVYTVFFKAGIMATQWGMKIKGDHLLAGLVSEGAGVGGYLLNESGLTQKIVDKNLNKKYGHKLLEPSSEMRFDEDGKVVMNAAIAEMEKMHHSYISTEHILLGILNSENDGKKILKAFKIDIDKTDIDNIFLHVYRMLNCSEMYVDSVGQKNIGKFLSFAGLFRDVY